MTVDAEGYVWSAIWYGGRVKRFAPDGTLDQEMLLPANQVASVTFGGPNLSDLYVSTSASNAADSMRPARARTGSIQGWWIVAVPWRESRGARHCGHDCDSREG